MASVALFGVMLAWLPRPVASQPSHKCPPPPPGVTAVAPAPEHCHHPQSGPCGDMLGCLATPPAMLAAPAGPGPVDVHAMVLVTRARTLHGRLALGPPTPPPNS